MKPEVSISNGGKTIPLDPLQVSFLHHMTRFQALQVSFLTPLAPVLSIYRCRFYTTPTLPPPMYLQIPLNPPQNRARVTEVAEHVTKRKELWEARERQRVSAQVEPKLSVRGRDGEGRPEGFATETAKASKSAIVSKTWAHSTRHGGSLSIREAMMRKPRPKLISRIHNSGHGYMGGVVAEERT